jgi:hypothetical protein
MIQPVRAQGERIHVDGGGDLEASPVEAFR